MTDAASPEATKRITRNRPTKYPAQLAVMVTDEMYAAIVAASGDQGVSKGEVARAWLERGRHEEQLDAEAALL